MDIDRRQPGLDRIAGSDLRLDQISHGTYFGEERGLRAIMDISARAISLDGVIGRSAMKALARDH